jgi:hypothetical protein
MRSIGTPRRAEAIWGEPELGADVSADVMRRPRTDIQSVGSGGDPARLDRRAAQAVVHQLDLDHAGGAGESGCAAPAASTRAILACACGERASAQ